MKLTWPVQQYQPLAFARVAPPATTSSLWAKCTAPTTKANLLHSSLHLIHVSLRSPTRAVYDRSNTQHTAATRSRTESSAN